MKTAVSLFSNIGVSEAYLDKIGVEVLVANELEEERCGVYRQIYPNVNMVNGDIQSEDTKKKIVDATQGRAIDFLFATPPCQGFSTLNSKKKDDPRNFLLTHALDVARRLKPSYILIENVPRMLSQVIDGKPILDFISDEMVGYKCRHKILDAADYGTPQSRRRAFVMLSKDGLAEWSVPLVQERITLKSVIGHLPILEPSSKEEVKLSLKDVELKLPNESEDNAAFIRQWHFAQKHNADHILWMQHTPEGESAFKNKEMKYRPTVDEGGSLREIKGYSNTYKRMDWDKPAPTLIAGSTMISSSNTVHPGRRNADGTYSDPRTLSVLEAMLVMGLPMGWRLPTDIVYRKAIHYLGEGLCPLMLKALVDPLV